MPRKPKPPVVYELDIQPLSGLVASAVDAPSVATTFVDDWGQVQEYAPQVIEQATKRAMNVRSREQMLAAAQRKHVQETNDMRLRQQAHAAEFMRKRMQPTLRTPASGGQRAIKLTEDLMLVLPAKPWRRL